MAKKYIELPKELKDIFSLLSSIIKILFSWLGSFIIKNKAEIYLVGSSYGKGRSDNTKVLFNYIKSLGKEVYFIENIPKGNNSLKRGSLKSFIYYFKSQGVFYSHSFSDILPGMHRIGWLVKRFKGPKKVFIQHGVTALKDVTVYFKSLKNTFDYVITVSEFEKNTMKQIGVPLDKIKITGFPRFDNLPLKIKAPKEIFVFLTWKSKEIYLKKLKEIVSILEKKNVHIKIAVHDMIKEELDVPKEYLVTDIGRAIRESGILITDDSSIAWDFFYNGREVIFYKSEEKWYLDEDFLNSRKVKTADELRNQLEKIKEKKVFPLIPNDLFEYQDKKNSKRVFDIINN